MLKLGQENGRLKKKMVAARDLEVVQEGTRVIDDVGARIRSEVARGQTRLDG